MLSAKAFPTVNKKKEIDFSVETIKEICEAFLLPQEIASENIKNIYKGLSDKSFWIALSDIHSITKGKLTDYGSGIKKDDAWEFEVTKE